MPHGASFDRSAAEVAAHGLCDPVGAISVWADRQDPKHASDGAAVDL